MPDTLTPRTVAGQRLLLLLSECDIRWPDEYTRIASPVIGDLIAKAENEARAHIDALTAAVRVALSEIASDRWGSADEIVAMYDDAVLAILRVPHDA
jgi:hypothetical protein